MKLILSTLIFALLPLAPAQAAKQINCSGKLSFGQAVWSFRLIGQVASSTRIVDVDVSMNSETQLNDSVYTQIVGRSDVSQDSPQEGTRFYLHNGNTSSFFLIPPGGALEKLTAASDDEVSAAAKPGSPHKFDFVAQHIFESYEEPGAGQLITDLVCEAGVLIN